MSSDRPRPRPRPRPRRRGFRVAIIGAGPAGCMLARLLLRGKIPVQIFEAESSLDIRNQGGTLDLHDDTGLAALQEAGLYDEFLRYARFDGDALSMFDSKMVRYLHVKSTTEDSWLSKFSKRRPEIDRRRLRQILLDSLPEGVICWGRRLRHVAPHDRSLHFEDGRVERGFDLVVGADGAFSKVRSLLWPKQPVYSGVGGYTMIISDAKEKHPLLYRLVNRGAIFAFSHGKEVIAQQMGDESIYVTEWSIRRQDGVEKQASGEVVKVALGNEYRMWSPEVRELLQAVDEDSITPRLLFTLPVRMRWANQRGITLIGDAAHLMTPFAGEGVNCALMDAKMLAHAIIIRGEGEKEGEEEEEEEEEEETDAIESSGTTADEEKKKKEEENMIIYARIQTFERNMFERATKAAALSAHIMELKFFTFGAPRTVIEPLILAFVTADSVIHPALLCVLKMGIYVYYWFFRLFY